MANKPPIPATAQKDEAYQGAPNSVVTLGYGSGYGWIYKAAGAIAGAAVAFFSTGGSNKFIEYGMKKVESLKSRLFGRGGLATGGAILGSIIGHYIGLAIGLRHGAQQAPRGRDQFDRIKTQRDDARHEVSVLREELKHSKSELASLTDEVIQDKSETPRSEIATASIVAQQQDLAGTAELTR